MTVFPLEWLSAAALLGALTFYLLFGGADFGAGLWTWCFRGPLAQRQRALVDQAIGPIWEANHVWLIVAVTILFTAFPAAFATLATALHIPLSLMLIGVVLRGTAFAVRTHDVTSRADGSSSTPVVWRRIFAGSSLVTPALLGITIGAVASGGISAPRTSDTFAETFIAPWLAPFPISVGLLTVALVAQLAAVYLLVESREAELKRLFRRRTFAASAAVFFASVVSLLLCESGAPALYQRLTDTAPGVGMVMLTGGLEGATMAALLRRRAGPARAFAAAGAVSFLWGWAVAQFPYLLPPL
ncbi:MAG TPA: cytochrome d ubiquinol oxidase subunit II, partial [Nitrospira sp.]|nr:cytochrome d ubiquinol oxidase subunit II [Nitrospira sp.]